LLYEGVCQVYKDIFYTNINSKPKEISSRPDSGDTAKRGDRVLVCLIQPGVFIGEEVLFSSNKLYEYTVKASSANVKLMAIKKENFKKYLPSQAITDIQTLYLNKKEHHEKMLERKLRVSTTLSFQKKPTIKQLHFGKPSGKSLTINSSTKTSSRGNNASRDCSINEDIKDTSIQISERKAFDGTKSMPNFLDNLQSRRTQTKDEHEEEERFEHENGEQEGYQKEVEEEKPQKTKSTKFNRSQQRSLTTFAIDMKSNQIMSRGHLTTPKVAQEGDINKIKTDFAKYSRKNVLEGVLFKDNSVRNNQDKRPDPKENFAIIEKRMESNSHRLPKINRSDITNLKFDFGSPSDKRSKSKEPESNEKLRASSLNSSKVNLKAIVTTSNGGTPKNSNTILQRISAYNRTESQILRSPSQGSLNQVRISNHTKEANCPPRGFVLQKKADSFATMKIIKANSTNVSPRGGLGGFVSELKRSPNTSVVKKAINLDWQPLNLELDGDYPEVGILGRNLPVSQFASPKNNRIIKKKLII